MTDATPKTLSPAVVTEDLGLCPFCQHTLRFGLDDIDGWISYVACDGCDFRGPMSEFKYADQAEAIQDGLSRWRKGLASLASPERPVERERMVAMAAALAAAISLLERGGKKAAASDKVFDQMLKDYRKALNNGRSVLSELSGRSGV